jgi:hypothetical protein
MPEISGAIIQVINALADNVKNINGKDYQASVRNNSAAVSADGSSSKSSDVAANKITYNQIITDKTAANKANPNSNAADANKINISNVNAANNGLKAGVNMSIINAQNAKTLNEDIKNNALNSENIKNSSAQVYRFPVQRYLPELTLPAV